MRVLKLLCLFFTVAFLATPAPAQEAPTSSTLCVGVTCEPLNRALRTALAEAGLASIDGLDLRRDVFSSGQLRLTIVSHDRAGLDRIATASKARTTPLTGTQAYVRAVPLKTEGFDITPLPGTTASGVFMHYGDDIDFGAGGSNCEEVCVCTEDGIECWYEC